MIKPIRFSVAAGLAAVVALSGCIQFEQGATLFPDGSGKMTLHVGFKKSLIKMLEEMAKQFGAPEEGKKLDPMAEFSDPEKLGQNAEGIVAWSEPVKKEDGDWVRISVIGYFEDINKVKISNSPGPSPTPGGEEGQGKKMAFEWKYEKAGRGGVLLMNREGGDEFKKLLPDQKQAEGNEELGKAMLELMKPMLEGFKFGISINVPGKIDEAVGFLEQKDRAASIVLDDKLLFAAMAGPDSPEAKKFKPLAEAKEFKVTWKDTSVTDAEIAGFKAELAVAKVKWAKTLEEHKKKKKEKGKEE